MPVVCTFRDRASWVFMLRCLRCAAAAVMRRMQNMRKLARVCRRHARLACARVHFVRIARAVVSSCTAGIASSQTSMTSFSDRDASDSARIIRCAVSGSVLRCSNAPFIFIVRAATVSWLSSVCRSVCACACAQCV